MRDGLVIKAVINVRIFDGRLTDPMQQGPVGCADRVHGCDGGGPAGSRFQGSSASGIAAAKANGRPYQGGEFFSCL